MSPAQNKTRLLARATLSTKLQMAEATAHLSTAMGLTLDQLIDPKSTHGVAEQAYHDRFKSDEQIYEEERAAHDEAAMAKAKSYDEIVIDDCM